MSRVAVIVPAESDLLCEGCGYTLNGLPTNGNCPECGRPIEQSIGDHRLPPIWEYDRQDLGAFLQTTRRVLFSPKSFFQSVLTRGQTKVARKFGLIHWSIASFCFALAAAGHLLILIGPVNFDGQGMLGSFVWITFAAMVIFLAACIICGLLVGTNWLAVRLTCWEAAYRGFRLPRPAVARGMYYHAAHYLPVALVAVLVVYGYWLLLALRRASVINLDFYLYTACGAVILCAVYLFQTYWIAMRNMMYANR